MSDSGLTTESAPPIEAVTGAGSSSPAGTPPGAVPVAAPAAPTDVLAEPPADQAVFSRGYVESIRQEAARYRTAAARYDDVFSQYNDEDQSVWFGLARTWADNPQQAAMVMRQIAAGVLGEDQQQQQNGAPQVSNNGREPWEDAGTPATDTDELTPERVKQMMDEVLSARDAKVAEQKAIDDVMSEVRSHGYDPNSAEGFMVLWNANHQTNGDIAAAVAAVKGYRQSIVDDYVAGRSSGRLPLPTSAGGVTATGAPPEIKNLEDARRATDAFLRERRGA